MGEVYLRRVSRHDSPLRKHRMQPSVGYFVRTSDGEFHEILAPSPNDKIIDRTETEPIDG